ncbi:MAG: hypothetical protein ACI9OO_002056 [Bacteroidia bacterium]|jgi:hypothetical protein
MPALTRTVIRWPFLSPTVSFSRFSTRPNTRLRYARISGALHQDSEFASTEPEPSQMI